MHRSSHPTRRPHPHEEYPLKADPFAQLKLLDLQQVDASLDQMAHRLQTLPELAALAQLAERRTDLTDRLGRLKTETDDLSRAQRKADADVEQVRDRRTRNRARIDGGLISDPKQLQAMQHEVQTLDRRISDLEDSELEVMERLEEAQSGLQILGQGACPDRVRHRGAEPSTRHGCCGDRHPPARGARRTRPHRRGDPGRTAALCTRSSGHSSAASASAPCSTGDAAGASSTWARPTSLGWPRHRATRCCGVRSATASWSGPPSRESDRRHDT